MKKEQLKTLLLSQLDDEINAALEAAKSAQQSAADKENKPENQYDTLSLEAAYLAHGQSERILQLQQQRIDVSQWLLPAFDEDDVIRLGALVQLQAPDAPHTSLWLWLVAIGGRQLILADESHTQVQLLSMQTPLAQALLNLGVGDEVAVAGGLIGEAGRGQVMMEVHALY